METERLQNTCRQKRAERASKTDPNLTLRRQIFKHVLRNDQETGLRVRVAFNESANIREGRRTYMQDGVEEQQKSYGREYSFSTNT